MSRPCARPSCGRMIPDWQPLTVLGCTFCQMRISRFNRQCLIDALAAGNQVAFDAALGRAYTELATT